MLPGELVAASFGAPTPASYPAETLGVGRCPGCYGSLMRLTVLGCSGGYPIPGAACSGYLVEGADTRLWVDAGTGTLDSLQRHLDLVEVDAVWISHLHPDHWTDLPVALHQLAVTEAVPDWPLQVFGPPGWAQDTGITQQWFTTKRPTLYRSVELSDSTSYQVGGLTLTVAAMTHGQPTFGVRIADGTSSVTYSADTSPCESLVRLAAEIDLLLCEATLPAGEQNDISTDPTDAARIALQAQASRLVLTHILPGVSPEASRAAAREIYGPRAELAAPGRVFQL